MTDIAGHLTIVSLDGSTITAQLNNVSLTQGKNVMTKATMDGTGDPKKLAGQRNGTLTGNGQVTPEGFSGLEVAWGKDTAVPFSLQWGELGGDTDAGKHDGNVTLGQLDIESAADDAINFVLSGETDSVVYTLPA